MARFITIGYGDKAGYERTDPAVRDTAHARDQEILDAGGWAGMAGTPVQVRNHDAEDLTTEQGSFLRSDLPVAGFGLIEAETLEEAIAMVSGTPCAVAQGVVEIWPIQEAADPQCG